MTETLVTQIQCILRASPELVKPAYRDPDGHPLTGHCYVGSEAYYHAAGGKPAGLTPYTVRHEGTVHWFLRDSTGCVIDVTAAQFETPVPYDAATARGFLTASPSKRAQHVLDQLAGDAKNGESRLIEVVD
jgi:hypothetical protein